MTAEDRFECRAHFSLWVICIMPPCIVHTAFIESSFTLIFEWCCVMWYWGVFRWNLQIVSISALLLTQHFIRFHNLLKLLWILLLLIRFNRIWMILNWLVQMRPLNVMKSHHLCSRLKHIYHFWKLGKRFADIIDWTILL